MFLGDPANRRPTGLYYNSSRETLAACVYGGSPHHRCSDASCRAFARGRKLTLKYGCRSNSALKQPPHVNAAHDAAPCSLAHQITETRFSARCPLRFIAIGQRERAPRLQYGRRAKEAALPAATAPHLLHLRPSSFPKRAFQGLSANSASCLLDFMSCSVALEVMPHSATSRATGDDISTIVDSNAGV